MANSNIPYLSGKIFVCKFVPIFRTDENPSGSCQPCSNNIHITYDDNTAAHWATVLIHVYNNVRPPTLGYCKFIMLIEQRQIYNLNRKC